MAANPFRAHQAGRHQVGPMPRRAHAAPGAAAGATLRQAIGHLDSDRKGRLRLCCGRTSRSPACPRSCFSIGSVRPRCAA